MQIDEHTACVDGTKVIIFGGFEDGCRTSTVRTFDLETHKWALLTPTSQVAPSPRAGHSATFHNDSMYIFGGKDDENQKLNDLWRFDMVQLSWTKIVTEGHCPPPRAGHSAVVYEGKIMIFGGIFEVTKEMNDCHLYDIQKNSWFCMFEEKNEDASAGSPTKIMAMGSVSPLLKKQGTMLQNEKSPKNTDKAMKNSMTQPPKIKLASEESKHQKPVTLDSPTSTDMQKSLLIANADPSFDYMTQLRKKKNNFGTFGIN